MSEITKARAERCVTHHEGCYCREYRLQQAEARIRELEAALRDVYEGLLPYVIGIPELDTPAKMHRRRIEALLTTPLPDSGPRVPYKKESKDGPYTPGFAHSSECNIAWSVGWNDCRRAMLAAAPQPQERKHD